MLLKILFTITLELRLFLSLKTFYFSHMPECLGIV